MCYVSYYFIPLLFFSVETGSRVYFTLFIDEIEITKQLGSLDPIHGTKVVKTFTHAFSEGMYTYNTTRGVMIVELCGVF